ncbi:hypothetical protein [Actinoplanes sp. NPDC023714]|uniref:hypothetical protein n=1 Tax=Actinoplanes sp. NPDC023714 TaxID=3154322 RepID=UPI0033FE9460
MPLDLVLQAGAAVVVLSFLISARWRVAFRPGEMSELRLHWLRYPVLALSVYVVVSAFLGAPFVAHALFVWLWVGLIPISILFGPVWQQINPLRTLFTLLRLPHRGLRPHPSRSAWPAAAFLLLFVWFELAVPHQGDPVAVGSFLLLYVVTQLWLATLRGDSWFARGDFLEVYSDLAGRLSPIAWRPWLSGLAAPLLPGSAAFLAIWWASTVFDSASASPFWAGLVQRTGFPSVLATLALALICALVHAAVRWTAGRLDVTASLIPIAVGYTLAHYLSLLLVEGPRGVLLMVQEWGLAPGAEWNVVPFPSVIAGCQIALILIGHVLGVMVAHGQAVADSPDRPLLATLADELPMVLFMIGCTWTGLFLLFVR